MDKIAAKLKTNILITFILGLLSATWIVIDYFVLDKILTEGLSKFSLEWLLIMISGATIIAFHLSVFVTIFYAFRIIRKIKSEHYKTSESLSSPKGIE